MTDEIIIFHGWHILAYPLTRVKIDKKLVEGVTYVPLTYLWQMWQMCWAPPVAHHNGRNLGIFQTIIDNMIFQTLRN